MNPKPGDRVILNDGEVAVVLDALEIAELAYVRRSEWNGKTFWEIAD